MVLDIGTVYFVLIKITDIDLFIEGIYLFNKTCICQSTLKLTVVISYLKQICKKVYLPMHFDK